MADVLENRQVNIKRLLDLAIAARHEGGPYPIAAALSLAVTVFLIPRRLSRPLIEARLDPMKYTFLRSLMRRAIGIMRINS